MNTQIKVLEVKNLPMSNKPTWCLIVDNIPYPLPFETEEKANFFLVWLKTQDHLKWLEDKENQNSTLNELLTKYIEEDADHESDYTSGNVTQPKKYTGPK